jgi:gamma-glutamyltranspeptidase
MAVTGKPIAASAGAQIFARGGNAVDAACAMIAATATAWTTLSWGGETQALIYNPHTGKVIAINGLGVAPTGATPEYFHKLGMRFPPEYGPLAAVTPGTPGGLMTMLAEYGTKSLSEVLAPACGPPKTTLAVTAAAITRPVSPPPPAGVCFFFDFLGLGMRSPSRREGQHMADFP